MKTKTKIITIVAAIMGFFMLALFFISSAPVMKSVEQNSSLIRTVELEQLTNGEQIENLISKFDYYDTSYDDTSLYFEGVLPVEVTNSDNISTVAETLEKKFKTRYNYTTNEFFVEVSLFDGETLIESWEKEATPQYDEALDEGYLLVDGEKVYFSECLDDSVLNNCFGPAAVAGVGVAVVVFAAAAVTIVAAPPSVYQEIGYQIEQVVETVVEAVKSFWSWLKRWVKKTFTREIKHEVITEVYTPSLDIDGKNIKTKVVTKEELEDEKNYPADVFFLCFVSSNRIYMSLIPISDIQAVAVLHAGIKVKDENNGKEMLASTFTRKKDDAYRVTVAAGLRSDTPYENPELDHGARHYHSNTMVIVNGKVNSPHSFFLFD